MFEIKTIGAVLVVFAFILIYFHCSEHWRKAKYKAARRRRYRRYRQAFIRNMKANEIMDKPEAGKRKGYTAFYSEELAEHFGGISIKEVRGGE